MKNKKKLVLETNELFFYQKLIKAKKLQLHCILSTWNTMKINVRHIKGKKFQKLKIRGKITSSGDKRSYSIQKEKKR